MLDGFGVRFSKKESMLLSSEILETSELDDFDGGFSKKE